MYELHKYGLIVSPDCKSWVNATDRLSLPSGAKHGNIFAVPTEVIDGLK
jgi:hypothetical protein